MTKGVDKLMWACVHLSHLMRKPTMWIPNRSDTNQAVQSQKQAGSLKSPI